MCSWIRGKLANLNHSGITQWQTAAEQNMWHKPVVSDNLQVTPDPGPQSCKFLIWTCAITTCTPSWPCNKNGWKNSKNIHKTIWLMNYTCTQSCLRRYRFTVLNIKNFSLSPKLADRSIIVSDRLPTIIFCLLFMSVHTNTHDQNFPNRIKSKYLQ